MYEIAMWMFIILSIIELFMVFILGAQSINLAKETKLQKEEHERLMSLIDEAKVVHEDVMNSAAKLTPLTLEKYLEEISGPSEPKMKVVNHTYLIGGDTDSNIVDLAYRSRGSEIKETIHFHTEKEQRSRANCYSLGCKTYYRGMLVELDTGNNG